MYFNRDTWQSCYGLSNVLRNARSVSFVEFTPSFTPGESGLVLARRAATADDISRFRQATTPWFLPFKPRASLCFEPHDRVEIIRADGTELTFLVCFPCGNFYFGPLDDTSPFWEVDLPPSSDKFLRSFFTSIAMTPKTREEYGAFSSYHKKSNDQAVKAQP